ncbi:MAG: ACT domain-containing protein, partial [Halolamina sp.]
RVDEVVTVSDNEIALALTYLLERSKTLVEGAGAVALAAVLAEKFAYEDDETIVPALCGGNIDLNDLTTVVVRGLVQMGRYIKIRTELKDNPGSLQRLVDIIADHNANIYGIQHDRTSRDVAMNAADVVIDLETHGHDHVDELLAALEAHGYEVETLV